MQPQGLPVSHKEVTTSPNMHPYYLVTCGFTPPPVATVSMAAPASAADPLFHALLHWVMSWPRTGGNKEGSAYKQLLFMWGCRPLTGWGISGGSFSLNSWRLVGSLYYPVCGRRSLRQLRAFMPSLEWNMVTSPPLTSVEWRGLNAVLPPTGLQQLADSLQW